MVAARTIILLRGDDESRSASRFALLVDALTVTTEFCCPREKSAIVSPLPVRSATSVLTEAAAAARAFHNGSKNSIIRILGKTDTTRTSEAR